ncbi:MAG: flagellar basal-body rod protein FlgF [Lachnospiraceae bacterium]|nr:flagellar basal-body rod protein FlgF [Lachnospiraceae bacterium]
MVKGLYIAYTGMINEQNRMDVLANSLANVDTTGFKKEGATSQAFGDILAYNIKDKSEYYLTKREGVMNPGVRIGETYRDFSEGPMHVTDNVFDLALTGSGFFQVEFQNKNTGENEVRYTRDGGFTLNEAGEMVTKDGDYVLDENGNHIVMDPLLDVNINRFGQIFQGEEMVATIGLTDFEDYNYLEKRGENQFIANEGAVQQPAEAQVRSGYLEQSNVNVVSEMVNMIAIQRQYESNQKVITTIDGTLDIAANRLGQLS